MSYRPSEAYFEAQQNHEGYVCLAVLTTVFGNHCFHAGICSQDNLPASGVNYHVAARLVEVSDLTATLIPDATDIVASFVQESPDCTITLSIGDDEFADFMSIMSFITAEMTVVRGFLTTLYADMQVLFKGVVTCEKLDEDDLLSITGVRQ